MRVSMVVISAALPFLVMASCMSNKGSFLLVNKAKEPIARAVVTVCGQTIEFKAIQPTKSASGSYQIKSDSHYDVRVEFESGRNLHKEIGYVTNGLDFEHEIVVTDTDIDITDTKAKPGEPE
jgi:hypothetical protein